MTAPRMTPADVLERAAALIEQPGKWTQGAFARAANGNPIGPLSPNATCWCAYGAIGRATGDGWPAVEAVGAFGCSVPNPDGRPQRDAIAIWNDAPERTAAEVAAALRACAAKLRQESPQ